MSSCRGHDEEPQEAVRPRCEKSSVEVAVGETVRNRIIDASVVEAVSFPDIVDVKVVGTVMHVTGVASGEGVVLLSADGQRLQCRVTVLDVRPDKPRPESPEIVGNLLSLSSDGRRISVVSLVTGENASFAMEVPLCDVKTGEMEPAGILVNDDRVVMQSCEVAKADADATWVHGITERGDAVWLVIPAGFFD